MKLIYFLLFLIFVSQVNAQDIDAPYIRVHYDTKFKKYKDSKSFSSDERILDIGKHTSKFYSRWETRNEEIKDSIFSRGGNLQELRNFMGKSGCPRSYSYYEVYKNYPETGKLTYIDKEYNWYKYEEKMEKPIWTIIPSERAVVADYSCQKAETTFRGRKWIVWFTIDIPVNDGPWKLYGLPGLILEAEDEKKEFSFRCIELRNIQNKMINVPKRKYQKCTRESFKQQITKSAKDPEGYLRQLGVFVGKAYDAQGRPMKSDEKEPIFMDK